MSEIEVLSVDNIQNTIPLKILTAAIGILGLTETCPLKVALRELSKQGVNEVFSIENVIALATTIEAKVLTNNGIYILRINLADGDIYKLDILDVNRGFEILNTYTLSKKEPSGLPEESD